MDKKSQTILQKHFKKPHDDVIFRQPPESFSLLFFFVSLCKLGLLLPFLTLGGLTKKRRNEFR